MTTSTSPVILDVRTPEEYAEGHIEGAVLLDFNSGEFAAKFEDLKRDTDYVLYCRSGNRSGQAAQMMAAAGFPSATNLGALPDAAASLKAKIVR